jgi:hypothetical protein
LTCGELWYCVRPSKCNLFSNKHNGIASIKITCLSNVYYCISSFLHPEVSGINVARLSQVYALAMLLLLILGLLPCGAEESSSSIPSSVKIAQLVQQLKLGDTIVLQRILSPLGKKTRVKERHCAMPCHHFAFHLN